MKEKSKIIFELDEMDLIQVKSIWTEDELLSKKGIFFLKDIAGILELDPAKVKKAARDIQNRGESSWERMGARKIWNHWIIRMTAFAPYFRKHLKSKYKNIPKDCNGNTLLEQKGLFLLTEVCRFIPFSAHQIRYQAKTHPRAKEEFGVWKEKKIGLFVVQMELFGPWIRGLWKDGFRPTRHHRKEPAK